MPSPIFQSSPHHEPESAPPYETPLTATPDGAAKNKLKLPSLRADDRVETGTTPPANENNMMLLMQQWQRGRVALLTGSKANLPLIIMFCGATVSVMWLMAAAVYINNIIGWQNIGRLRPHEIGGFLAGLLAPVALFWMMLTFWLRSVDVKLYAEALRTEIQALIFPSEEAERRVNNDVERLVRQTAEMARATRTAMGALAKARQAVQEETQALQQGAQGTAGQLDALAQRLAERQQALADLQSGFTQQGAAFETVSRNLVSDATAFNALVEQTADKSAAIGAILQQPVAQLQKWQDDIVDALNAGMRTLDDKRSLLRLDVADIEEKATSLAGTLHTATAKLYNFTDDALDKAKLIETRLQGQGVSLQETLAHIAAQTEQLTDQRNRLLSELAGATQQGRNELADHVTLLTDTLNQLQATHEAVAGRMNQLLDTAASGWTAQAGNFNDTVAAGATRTTQQLDDAGERLQQTYQAVQDNLDNVTAQMSALFDRTSQRIQDTTATAQDALSVRQTDMENFVGALTDTHRQALTKTADDLVRLQTGLNTLAAQLAESGVAVSERGAATAESLQNVQQALHAGLVRVEATTGLLQTGLTQTVQALDVPLNRLDQAAQNVSERAHVIGNMLDQRVTHLTDLGSALTHQAMSLGTDLTTKSRQLENVLALLQGEVRTINADMAAQAGLLDGHIRVTVDQVAQIVPQIREIQQNFALTNQQVELTQGNILRLSDVAQDQGQALASLSENAAARIADSLNSYKELQDTYRTTHEATLAEHARMRDNHALDIAALTAGAESLRRDAGQISERYDRLQDMLQALGREAAQTRDQAHDAQAALQQVQGGLVQSGRDVQQQTAGAVQNLRIVQQILEGSAQSTLNHVENLTTAMQQADRQSLQLQDRVAVLFNATQQQAERAAETALHIDEATRDTADTLARLTGFTDTVTQLQDGIADQHDRFTQQQSAVEAAITQALDQLRSQTEKLAGATQDAGEQAEAIRAQDQALQRDYFFNATKFIVESLHSLALDFTRMLDGELPEKTWKAYKLGDTSAFAKRLVGLRDTLSHDKLRQKFADDVEFRTYVQRYIRQFEEIHEHAKRQDYGDLLSGVFTSSDIGRLYQMLKNVVAD